MNGMEDDAEEIRVAKLMEGKLSLSNGDLPDGVNMDALSLESQQEAELNSQTVEQDYEAAFEEAGGQKAVDAGLKSCQKELRDFERHCKLQKLPETQLITWQGKTVNTYLNEHYDKEGREMAKELLTDMFSKIGKIDESATIKIAEPKGLIRTIMKCRMKYGNDVTKLTDAERCTIAVSHISKVYDALKIILQDFGQDFGREEPLYAKLKRNLWKDSGGQPFLGRARPKKEHMVVVEVDDRFKNPMSSNYRHLQVLLRIWGVIWEVQINVRSILEVKENSGHEFYKTTRFVQEYLLLCSSRGDMNMMKDLLNCQGVERIINPNAVKDRNGLTCLHHAATVANMPFMTQTLVDRGANSWAIDKCEKWFPITFSLAFRQWETSNILAHKMLKDSERKDKIFFLAVEENDELVAIQSCTRWLNSAMGKIDFENPKYSALKELHEQMEEFLAGFATLDMRFWLLLLWINALAPFFSSPLGPRGTDFSWLGWLCFIDPSIASLVTILHFFSFRKVVRHCIIELLRILALAHAALIGFYLWKGLFLWDWFRCCSLYQNRFAVLLLISLILFLLVVIFASLFYSGRVSRSTIKPFLCIAAILHGVPMIFAMIYSRRV